MNKKSNNFELVQDYQLRNLAEKLIECVIITVNGVQMKGIILFYDRYCIVLQNHKGINCMIYKHAISTIKF
ncbi:hypothetical protein BBD42_16895 [Paenibacillus sp. BIHB 4019]|uniref:RNA chaperone Hfq n=1 Tax=Paenibacillus sp. BIHB 4019 TaxID=1870819 RepID=A0A1B2DJS9_9BACL|nr:hypothetical protein BBD42_16895 [Paenibacillus sp. BIHB 4019]